MPNTPEGQVRIAVLEAELRGLREQQRETAKETKESIASLARKVDALTEIMNQGKGAFSFAMFVAAVVGSFITAALNFFFSKQ
jgi:hypothetical protein